MYNNFENNNDERRYEIRNERPGLDRYVREQQYGRQIQPEQLRYTQQPPHRPQLEPQKPRKKKSGGNAGRVVAAFAAVAVLSAAVSGTTSYIVTQNALDSQSTQLAEIQQAVTTAAQPTQVSTGTEKNADVISLDNAQAEESAGTITNVANKAGGAVVEIATEVTTTQPFVGDAVATGGGSGVIYTSDGYIITNNHVVEGANSVKVTLQDGTEYDAQVIGTDTKTDLAVVKIEAEGLPTASLADSDSLQVGETAIAIGNPLGELGGTVTSGIVSATTRDITIGGEAMTLIQTSAAVNPGNSGGGLFNAQGQLIGIVNAKLAGSEIEGLAFAIPSNTVSEIVEEIMNNGYVAGRSQMGIGVVEILDNTAAMRYRINVPGVYIADNSGQTNLQSGDRIVSIGETAVESIEDISTALEGYSVGDEVEVKVERGEEQYSGTVTLGEQSPDSQMTYENEDVVSV